MKNTLMIGSLATLLTGCGVNKIPEVSDIKKSLEEQFSECKYVEFSDVEKLNGRDLGSGRYSVSQKYTFEILPLKGYTDELEKIEKTEEKIKEIEEALRADSNQREEKIKSEIKQLESDFRISSEAHNEKYQKALSMGMSNTELQEEAQRYNEVNSRYKQRWNELNNSLYRHNGSYSSELSEKLVAAGYSENIKLDLDMSYTKLHKRAIQEFDSACKNMSSKGKSKALEVAGLSPGSQMSALTKGKAMSITENVIYIKTEKGWIRQ